ncbi:UNVERIFIED_CONTAM: Glucose-1-phosphate adenylyltransferase large subunit, chloroplastic/amyloplastic [Sesamum radiatum]|uniref:glucose-1-phosphate adenylyltransferase n=1 Tax=Sesamum radiatum TaxID=300843 RepID=A0AAW2M2L3_SESRA
MVALNLRHSFEENPKADPGTVASIILGGGAGTRLFPLTSRRAKPAVLAATQTSGDAGKRWFQGTADAVRQFIWVFEDAKNKNVEHILILSGDHLYRMDYMDFVQKHIDTNADITVSCVPMDDSRASDYGLMKVDETGRIIQFAEKPKGSALKSMAYLFSDYWEDIGTIKSFFDANLALTDQSPKFDFNDPKTPFYTSPRFLPPTKVEKCRHSIVGVRSRLDYGVELKGVEEADRADEGFYIRSGITVILKNSTIKDGTII